MNRFPSSGNVLFTALPSEVTRDCAPGLIAPRDGPVSCLDIRRKTVLVCLVGILRHAQLLLDLIERFSLAHHLACSLQKQFVVAHVVVKELGSSRKALAWNDISGFRNFIIL